jgi:integrase
VAQEAERWQRSRIDLAATTKRAHRIALAHILARFGERDPASLTPADVATWVGELSERLQRGSVEKALGALRQLFDFSGVDPNPARDPRVRLPRAEREEIEPPTAAHVEAIVGAVAPRYRLPLVVLETSGMRIGELEALRWGDVDEIEGRWRVARQHEKTRRGRWVNVPPVVFEAVLDLLPREDREPEAAIFPWLTQARLRTEMNRACRAAGVPLYSPHDLRHRRISLWHRQGIDWARIGQ